MLNSPISSPLKTTKLTKITSLQKLQQSLTTFTFTFITKLYQQSIQSYKAQITKQQLNKCSFSTFDDFKDYIYESQQNYQVNTEEKFMRIVTISSLRGKQNIIELLKINIQESATDINNKMIFNKVLDRLQKNQELTNKQIKQFFNKIITFITLDNTKNNNANYSNQVFDSIINKITVAGTNTQNLKTTVINIGQKVQKIERITNQYLQTKQLIDEKIEMIQQKTIKHLSQLQSNLITQLQKSYQKFSQIQKQNINTQQKYQQNINKTKQDIKKINQQLKTIKQKITQKLSSKTEIKINNQPNIMVQIKNTDNIQKYFTVDNSQINNYGMSGMKIVRTSSSIPNTGIVGKIPILQRNRFSLKIVNTQNWGISVGIKDFFNNQIIKYGGNGWINDCGSATYGQGKGLNSGDNLEVIVDIQNGQIKWKIINQKNNYIYLTTCKNKKISSKQRFWVPFIFSTSEGDQIQLI